MTNVIQFPRRKAEDAEDWDGDEAKHWAERVDAVRDAIGRAKWSRLTTAEKYDAFKAHYSATLPL